MGELKFQEDGGLSRLLEWPSSPTFTTLVGQGRALVVLSDTLASAPLG